MREEHYAGLEEALKRGGGTHTMRDLLGQLARGDAQLHATEDAVIVTEIHDTPRARVVHFWLATGELRGVIDLSGTVLEWARAEGCTRATLAGRRGWEKVLASEGWTPELTLMARSV